jgi:hypothetical protein
MNGQQMNHFNLWQIPSAHALAAWNNNLQRFAEQTRLGIPVTIASDPRNHFTHNIFSMAATEFSQWCETLGFAAIGDEQLVRQFAQTIREEYLATGIRVALHRRLTWRPSRAGRASAGPLARMRTCPPGWEEPTSRACRARRLARAAWRA